MRTIEKDKLFYFVLAYSNPQKVLVIKSPSDNKEQKAFLGYGWSDRKGAEGIQLTTDSNGTHLTPLYDLTNRDNPEKINALITQNFLGEMVEIPDVLKPFASLVNLVDMLDFSRKDFSKAISLNDKKSVEIQTRWDLVKLGDICKLYQPKTITSAQIKDSGLYKVFGANGVIGYYDEFNHESAEIAITCRGATCGTVNVTEPKSWITGNAIVAQPSSKDILKKYLFETLIYCDLSTMITGTAQPQITRENLSPYKIPLPPLDIQQQIVSECEAIDGEVEQAQQNVKNLKSNITDVLIEMNKYGETKKLEAICSLKAGQFVSASDISDKKDVGLYPCYGGNGLRGYTKKFTHDGTFPLIGRQGALCGNVHKVTGKFHATEHAIAVTPLSGIDVNWLYYQLKFLNLNQYKTGVAQPGLSVQNLQVVLTPVPPLSKQQTLVTQIETFEKQIDDAQKVIDGAASRKAAVLRNYL